ncbi:MAG: acetate--CoA ligase [Bacteroidetes bacterium]|nr:acetate--CoA ligase [Bacteroidota bacterium]
MLSKSSSEQDTISSVQIENRIFPPPQGFSEKAHIKSSKQLESIRKKAAKNPVEFWEEQARSLHWFRLWNTAFKWKNPNAEWFGGGKINISYNCLDRHLSTWRRNKAALIWEGEPEGEIRTLTYSQLHHEVCKCAGVLRSLGVQKSDVVAIYMGMVPEAVIAMLACARIGATHNVVFGGFSAEALRERINDSKAVVLITQDGAFRRGTAVNLKQAADTALENCPTIKHSLVLRRTGGEVTMKAGRDHWWHDLMRGASADIPAEPLGSEHSHFILYTSGSTGKPKGILHTTGGYLTHVAYTTKVVFDIRDDDLYFCTADIGWVTGHSYIVYGPLANGASILMYEGAPNFPEPDRFWDIIERHKVTVFYTAPTAIRAFIRWGDGYPMKHDLSSLRLIGTVGEPINPEAWMWYRTLIGKNKCPIVDTWWQTETGGIMIAPIPGATDTKPGSATHPIPGIIADVVRKDGTSCKPNEGGLLVVKHPWPGMARTIFGDKERFKQTYWSNFPPTDKHEGWYFTGDGARKDADGCFWIMGRVDDVVNVSGHRLGTAEVESALVSHPFVAEAAVVAKPDELKGNALVAFVTLKANATNVGLDKLKEDLRNHVGTEIGHIAKPDEIRFTEGLPKTRSGKIMRRLLREIVSGSMISGDTTTLEDFSVLEKLRGDEE